MALATNISVPLTGLSANDPEPGNYVEVNFAQGASSGAGGLRPILLIGNKSTAGDATPDTQIYGPPSPFGAINPLPLASMQDAINRFGQGSELHRMFKRVLAVNTTTPVYAIAVTESIGAAATGVITITATATNNGSARTFVLDEFVDAPITNGDLIATVAASIVAAVNSKLDWPVTAAFALGVVTLTAKNKGPRGNWIRFSCNVVGTSVGTTSSASAIALFTGGTTADSNAAALATIANSRYYYIASAAEDATQLGAVVTQVGTQALPTNGLREVVYGASVDTIANLTTIATGINGARCQIPWLQNADYMPSELAANQAAVESFLESSTVPRLNMSGFGQQANDQAIWKIKAPRTGTTPSRATRVAALNNGIQVIGVLQNGTTYIDKRVTTRSLSGAVNDYRIRDPHKVRVCDFFADDLVAKQGAQFQGKNIIDDPVVGQLVPPNTVSARGVKAATWKLIDDYGDKGLLQNVAAIKAGVIVNREPGTTSRMSQRIPLQVADILDQIASAVDQL